MPIPITPPIVTKAVSSKTFDQWFYTNFSVSNISSEGGDLSFTKMPQVSNTGELLPSEAVNVCVPFWTAVAAIPSAASAMGAVLAALPEIETWSKQ